ncbi:Uncharacterized protein Fot_24094 [Forsythia ovata]|uniref:Uncharacterized protein n=1 Tax=Forsythia ovata TaxID=205694 RepID=A0ABD1U575_9LAMI
MEIRVRLAVCGARLVGDSMYMPVVIAEMHYPGLNPFGENKKAYSTENDKALHVEEWIVCHGKSTFMKLKLRYSARWFTRVVDKNDCILSPKWRRRSWKWKKAATAL